MKDRKRYRRGPFTSQPRQPGSGKKACFETIRLSASFRNVRYIRSEDAVCNRVVEPESEGANEN